MVLPDGIKFMSLGWWIIHALAILLAYQFGFNKGRAAEKKEWRARELEKGR